MSNKAKQLFSLLSNFLGKCLLLSVLLSASFLVTAQTTSPPTSATAAIDKRQKAFLGIGYQVVSVEGQTEQFGYRINRVLKDTAADIIGLEAGDIIIAFDGQNVSEIDKDQRQRAFRDYIQNKTMGDTLTLKVLRHDSVITQGDTTLEDIKTLKSMIDNQPAKSTLEFRIAKTRTVLNLSALLGTRQTVDENEVPTNQSLFPEYQNLTDPYGELVHAVISHYQLNSDYQDLLQRYRDNELWDDGFRLNLFRYLHRDPIKLLPVIDKRLTALQQTLTNEALPHGIVDIAELLDVNVKQVISGIDIDNVNYPLASKQAHIDFITQQLTTAEALRKQAFSQLNTADINYLKQHAPQLIKRFQHSFYIDRPDVKKDRDNNIKIISLAKKVDFISLFKSAQTLSTLFNQNWLEDVNKLFSGQAQDTQFETDAGAVLIGGVGDSRHQQSYALLIDLSGDDFYTKDSGRVNDALSVIIDLSGDDEHQHTRAYAQGSAFLGIGMLYDLMGNDIYTAKSHAQGYALLAAAILIDDSGDDQYFAGEFAQSVAFWGMSLLSDKAGDDDYRSHLYAQGLGGVKGAAILFDQNGNDSYIATGGEESSYQVSGVFKGASQGVGIGFRGYASGGIGVLLDAQGEDELRAGNFSQGVGYFYGLGVVKQTGDEKDSYRASRYSQGASAHSAIGVLIDEGGDDDYSSINGVSQSAAWDLSLAALWDKGGDDNYRGSNAFSSHNGFSLFVDEAGRDSYHYISGGKRNDYHGGVSFGIFIDSGGDSDYYQSQRYQNNTIGLRDQYGLFLDLRQPAADIKPDVYLPDNTF